MKIYYIFTEMTDGTSPSIGAATSESGFGIRVIDAGGTVQTRIFSVLAVLIAVGTRPALPSVEATANEIGHQIDASAVVATRIAGTIVHVYTSKIEMTK